MEELLTNPYLMGAIAGLINLVALLWQPSRPVAEHLIETIEKVQEDAKKNGDMLTETVIKDLKKEVTEGAQRKGKKLLKRLEKNVKRVVSRELLPLIPRLIGKIF